MILLHCLTPDIVILTLNRILIKSRIHCIRDQQVIQQLFIRIRTVFRVELVRAGEAANRTQAGSRSRLRSRLSQAEGIYTAALLSAVNTLQLGVKETPCVHKPSSIHYLRTQLYYASIWHSPKCPRSP